MYEYIFGNIEAVENTSINKGVLADLRREFMYWMPADVEILTNGNIRTTGLFTIFDSVELLGEDYCPKSYIQSPDSFGRMYRSDDARPPVFLQTYPADVVRLVLSTSIDKTDYKINCEQSECNTGIIHLTKEFGWIQQTYDSEQLLDGEDSMEFPEILFSNQINLAIINATEAFEKYVRILLSNYLFSLTYFIISNKVAIALKEGFYQLMNYRDNYRSFCESASRPMNKTLIHRYIRTLVIMLSPICPHITEHTWLNILQEEDSILKAKWPVADPVDEEVLQVNEYLTSIVSIAQARKKIFFTKQVLLKSCVTSGSYLRFIYLFSGL